MIHAIRKLARAVNRRSVWQVLGVYALSSWAAWVLVALGTDAIGLPAWTPTLTLSLLVAMLPVFVATAVAQGGLPGLRIEDEIDPNDLVGLTPDQVLVVPEAHPLYGSGIFTWRNTVLGAVSCVALVVTSVVAYMTMWALGIGPVGSLLAQGVIAERDPVVLVAFENRTDDSSLAALVTDAFELELSRSRVVTLADPASVLAVAVELGADPSSPLTTEAAHRVAEQQGLRLILSGDVGRRGSAFVLRSGISLPSGSVVARFEEAYSGEDELLAAVEHLSERVRERLGESLRVIREGERLASISTDSDDALRLLRQSDRASLGGDLAQAIALLEQSIDTDPSFAMGWRRLGVLSEQAANASRAREAYQAVIDLWEPSGRAQRTVRLLQERIAALD
ncbi:MAG: penicillin-binding protein activator LpoB [Gemmatimonadota bacterium]|nr:penicillin-binding protein activator LpoB [Gemmatimonadota bacterium]